MQKSPSRPSQELSMLCKTNIYSRATPSEQQAMVWLTIIPAPFGKVGIETMGTKVLSIRYLEANTPDIPPQGVLAEQVVTQLKAYFADPSFRFDLPLEDKGTSFQKSVWKAISAIPLGKAFTYAELAKQLKTGPRAIGQACGTNPFPLVVPCHRVVLSSGGIGGFAKRIDADWQGIKRWLLKHEGALAAGQ